MIPEEDFDKEETVDVEWTDFSLYHFSCSQENYFCAFTKLIIKTLLNHFYYQDATALSLLMKRMMISQKFSAFKSVFRIKINLVCI